MVGEIRQRRVAEQNKNTVAGARRQHRINTHHHHHHCQCSALVCNIANCLIAAVFGLE